MGNLWSEPQVITPKNHDAPELASDNEPEGDVMSTKPDIFRNLDLQQQDSPETDSCPLNGMNSSVQSEDSMDSSIIELTANGNRSFAKNSKETLEKSTTKRKIQEKQTVVPDKKAKTFTRTNSIVEEPVHEIKDLFIFEDLEIPCDRCYKVFPTESDRICHAPCFWKRDGLSNPPRFFPCRFGGSDDKCSKEYYNLSGLKNHMITHYEGNYRCRVCSFRTCRKPLINKHIAAKHDSLLK